MRCDILRNARKAERQLFLLVYLEGELVLATSPRSVWGPANNLVCICADHYTQDYFPREYTDMADAPNVTDMLYYKK